ncbi:hypothetical protein IT398_01025 [Candidatus Nomurabacteria bacterium]|nr:hypothetical protein [Candidatus Nomurabacteria bacterium]
MSAWEIVWPCVGILVIGLVSGFYIGQFCRNKIPIIDWGHRCFVVPNERATKVLLALLKPLGLRENFTFSPGKTNQTVLNDGTTVFVWFDESVPIELQKKNGISIVTKNPQAEALRWGKELQARGYCCVIRDDVFPPKWSNKVVVLETNALVNSVIVFRRHSLDMGGRPGLRKITSEW